MPPTDQDIVLTKLDAMQFVIDSRFDAHRREQDGIVKWLERLTSTLESQVALTGTLFRVEERMRSYEANQIRAREDIDHASDQLSEFKAYTASQIAELKTNSATSGVKLGAIVGTVVLVITAAAAAFFDKFFG